MSQQVSSPLNGAQLASVKDIPFQDAIQKLYDAKVLEFDRSSVAVRKLLTDLSSAMRDVCTLLQSQPIVRPRPNEVGNDLEGFVIASLNEHGFVADRPKTSTGKGMSAGYPDLEIEHDPVIYLEVKSHSSKHRDSTPRSFFFSHSDDPKVTKDGYHLAVGFEMEQVADQFWPVNYKLVDLYGLRCDLKFEFNSNNQRLYDTSRLLASERVERLGSEDEAGDEVGTEAGEDG